MHQAIARAVERGHDVRLAALELVPQQLPEQVVVAVPLASPVEGHHEAVRCARASRASAPIPSSRARRRTGRRTCARSTEVCLRNCASAAGSRERSSRRKYSDTNRSSPAKRPAPAGLGAPACSDSAARYRPAGQPSVRSVSSASSLASSSTPAASSSSRLPLVQPEVRHADLVHQSLRPPAGERQRRLLPARDRDLRAGRDVLEQRREHVQTGRIGDGVQIVEHQHQRALERSQRAPDARDALRPGGSPGPGQRVEHLGRERLDAVNRRRDVAQEHHGVVVSPVERDPRERTRVGLGPPREQRRLAVPGGRDHGHERRGRARTAVRSRPPSPPCPAGSTAQRA